MANRAVNEARFISPPAQKTTLFVHKKELRGKNKPRKSCQFLRIESMNSEFDAIVIGGGQGASLGIALAKAGRKTALIERAYFGGTCVNYGCTPTKTMVASAQVAHTARHSDRYGVYCGGVTVEMKDVVARKNAVVEDFRQSVEANLEHENLQIFCGEAKFTGHKAVQVLADGKTHDLTAETIVIAVGTHNKVPPVEGLDGVDFLDSTSIMELDVVPEHLMILGGGYISVEFGQMFRRFGARVTIIEKNPQLLSREDADVAQRVREILQEDGLEILCDAKVQSVAQDGDEIALQVLAGAEERELRGSHLLVAIGRAPSTGDLGLEKTGVECDEKGYLQVDAQLQTNVAGIYGLGEVAGSPPFTHIAYDDFRILCANLTEDKNCDTKDRLIPWVVFMNPQLGRIGVNEKEAREKGVDYAIAQIEMDAIARPLETGQTRGFWKVLIAPDGEILGGSFLSMEGGEVMAMLQLAMIGKLSYDKLRDLPIAHPTLAESFNNLFLKFDRDQQKGHTERHGATGA